MPVPFRSRPAWYLHRPPRLRYGGSMPWPRACLALSIAFLATPHRRRRRRISRRARACSTRSADSTPPRTGGSLTTDSTRYVVQVGKIGDDALSRLKPGHGTKSAPDPLQWSSISRVDLRKSKFLSRRIQGVVLGAIVGGLLPVAFGAEGDPGTELGLLVGAAAGGLARRPLRRPADPRADPLRVAESR